MSRIYITIIQSIVFTQVLQEEEEEEEARNPAMPHATH
jgi:hypothetical protein